MQIYYYTRTGRSERIAEKIAQKHGVEAKKIEDTEDWKGLYKFLKGGYMSAKKEKIVAKYEKPTDGDDIVLVFPIWAGSFPPTVRTFIDEVSRNRIVLIPTSLTSKLSDRDGFIRVTDLIGKNIDDLPLEI